MKKQRKRIYTALLCTCFLFSTASVPVSAAETEQEEMITLSNRSGVVTVKSVQAMIDALGRFWVSLYLSPEQMLNG